MTRRNGVIGACLVMGLAVGLAHRVCGQEEKPAPKAKREKPAAAKPAASKPAAPKDKGAEKPTDKGARAPKAIEVPVVPPPPDPAVEAVLETNPTTPAECLQAARTLSNLHRDDLGRAMLKKVLDAHLDDEHLNALVEHFGSTSLMNLADRKGLLPEARQLLGAVIAAGKRLSADAQRMAGLVAQLRDPAADVRYQAMTKLQQGGGNAVMPLLTILADPQHAADHAAVRDVLVNLKNDAAGPLLSVLQSSDKDLVVQAIDVLGRSRLPEVLPYLLAPALAADSPPEVQQAAQAALDGGALPTDRSSAAALLAGRAREYFEKQQPIAGTVQGRALLWQWDAAKRLPVAADYPAETAACIVAARLAGDAYRLAPTAPDIRSIYFISSLEADAQVGGFDKPLDSAAPAVVRTAKLGLGELQQLLDEALRKSHPAAATALVQILGKRGNAEALIYQGSRPAPVVLATRQADRRLRMAALEAVLNQHPTRPYAGSSYVADALTFFAASRATRRVLLAALHPENLLYSVGGLSAEGYQVDTASDGRAALRLALASPDYEILLIDAAIDRPPADLLLQQLRQDGRTAMLPVGLLAREEQLQRARAIAAGDPLCVALVRPHDTAALKWELGQLNALTDGRRVSLEIRRQQAARALTWLAGICAGPEARIYDLRRVEGSALTALHVAELARPAIAILAHLGTPESQRALVDLASRPAEPLGLRTAAATAFADSLHRFGILLATQEIQQQYDRYNQSQNQDRDTQRVLGLLLDAIERRATEAADRNAIGAGRAPGSSAIPSPEPRAPHPQR